MIVVFITTAISIFLAYLSGIKKYSKLKLFEFAFFLVTFIACIHYNYGTDYPAYYKEFLYLSQNSSAFNLLKSGYYKEPLWVFLNYIMPAPYGFFLIVAILNIVQNSIYYRFIRDYCEERKRWIPFSLYLLLTSFYVLNFSMIRQGFAIAMCLAAGLFAGKKRWIPAVAMVLVASMVHISALIFLPFVFISFLPLKNGRIYAVFFLVISVILYFFRNATNVVFSFLFDNISSFSSYLDYTNTIEGWGNTLGVGFILESLVYAVFFYFMIKRFDEFEYEQRLFIVYSCFAFCIIPFQMDISSLIGRIGNYFSVYKICMVPIVYSRIRTKALKYLLSFIFIFMMFVGYYQFFFNSWSVSGYETFHSIFEVIF